jgi:predicted nucleotidyltransferase
MFTKLQSQILAVLIENPQKELHLSRLGDILDRQPGVFQKGLNALEKEGYVTSRRQGNQRLFRVNTEHPFFAEVGSIIRKSYGIEGLLRDIVGRIKGIRIAFIYGSYAKKRMMTDSDIDMIVVLSNLKAQDELIRCLSDVEQKVGREINYSLYSVTEFAEKLREKDPFLSEILTGKTILLKGEIR